jgi:predicted metal-dependent hydrolase
VNKAKPTRREMLLVNGREIPVAVVRSRRARRYILRVREDGLARLTIPRSGSTHEAWAFAQRQGAWLEQQLQHLASRPVRSKEWRVGTEILFRGEKIKIEIFSESDLAIHRPDSFFDDSPSPRPSPLGRNDSDGVWWCRGLKLCLV